MFKKFFENRRERRKHVAKNKEAIYKLAKEIKKIYKAKEISKKDILDAKKEMEKAKKNLK